MFVLFQLVLFYSSRFCSGLICGSTSSHFLCLLSIVFSTSFSVVIYTLPSSPFLFILPPPHSLPPPLLLLLPCLWSSIFFTPPSPLHHRSLSLSSILIRLLLHNRYFSLFFLLSSSFTIFTYLYSPTFPHPSLLVSTTVFSLLSSTSPSSSLTSQLSSFSSSLTYQLSSSSYAFLHHHRYHYQLSLSSFPLPPLATCRNPAPLATRDTCASWARWREAVTSHGSKHAEECCETFSLFLY